MHAPAARVLLLANTLAQLASYIHNCVNTFPIHYARGQDLKNRSNIRRHKLAFEDAQRIFEGPTVERVDDRLDYGEVRVYAIGLVNGLEITVIYTGG